MVMGQKGEEGRGKFLYFTQGKISPLSISGHGEGKVTKNERGG